MLRTGTELPRNKEIELDKKGEKANVDNSHGDRSVDNGLMQRVKKKLSTTEKEQKKGEDEAKKEAAKEHLKQEQLMEDMLSHSSRLLFRAKAIFPFDFFPNELIIDLSKVTFIERAFFGTNNTNSVYIKDIANVGVETGPFLATFRVVDVSYNTEKHVIHYLKRKDAITAQEIVQGLVTASKEELDLTKVTPSDVIPFIRRLSGMQKIADP